MHFGTVKGNGLVRFSYVKAEYATEHQLYKTGETCFLFQQQASHDYLSQVKKASVFLLHRNYILFTEKRPNCLACA